MTSYTTIIRAILRSEGIEVDAEEVKTKMFSRLIYDPGSLSVVNFIELVIQAGRKLESKS